MTKQEFIEQFNALSPDQIERVLPYLEADVAAVDRMADLKQNIEAGRRSAEESPLEDAADVYSRVRKSL